MSDESPVYVPGCAFSPSLQEDREARAEEMKKEMTDSGLVLERMPDGYNKVHYSFDPALARDVSAEAILSSVYFPIPFGGVVDKDKGTATYYID